MLIREHPRLCELFLTPESDPWLGLVPDEFAAIDNGGIVEK